MRDQYARAWLGKVLSRDAWSFSNDARKLWLWFVERLAFVVGESRRLFLCVGGKEKRFAYVRDGCCAALLEECMLMRPPRCPPKDCARGVLLGPVRWQYYAASADKKALKKGLIGFDVTMKPQVRGIE